MYKQSLLVYRAFRPDDLSQVQNAIDSRTLYNTSGIFCAPPGPATLSELYLNKDDLTLGRIKLGGFDSAGKLRCCLDLLNIDLVHGKAEVGLIVYGDSCRGKGFGSEMLKLAQEISYSRLNLRFLYANVFSHNERSLGFFAKHGWERISILPKWALIDQKEIDLVVFKDGN